MSDLFLSPTAAWTTTIYQQTAVIVLLVIFIGGAVNYFFRRKNHYSMVAWASIKSWLVLICVARLSKLSPSIFFANAYDSNA